MIYRTESYDEAINWSEAKPVEPNLSMGGGAFAATVLHNGHVLIIFNNNEPNLPTSRSPLTVAISSDDGLTFPAMKVRVLASNAFI